MENVAKALHLRVDTLSVADNGVDLHSAITARDLVPQQQLRHDWQSTDVHALPHLLQT